MNSEGAARKNLIKNITIAFLALMLILTFFSNTIMNRSLPEVSTKTPVNGTISENVRGSGRLEAEKTYDVIVDETRTVKAVYVKTGDTVEKGDIIYSLEDIESTELEEARRNLSTYEADYKKALITAEGGTQYLNEILEIENARNDLSDAQRDLSRFNDEDYLKTKYAADYLALERLNTDIELLTEQTKNSEYKGYVLAQLESKATETDQAIACLDTEDFSPLPAEWYEKLTAASDNVKQLEKQKEKTTNKRTEIEKRKTAAEGYISALDTDEMLGLPTKYYDRIKKQLRAKNEAKGVYELAKQEYDAVSAKVGTVTDYDDNIKSKQREIDAKQAEINKLTGDLSAVHFIIVDENNNYIDNSAEAEAIYTKLETARRELRYLQEDLESMVSKNNNNMGLTTQLKTARTKMENAQTSYFNSLKSLDEVKKKIKYELIDDLNKVKKELEDYDASPENQGTSSAADEAEKRVDDAKRSLSLLKNEARTELRTKKADIDRCKSLLSKKEEYEKSSADFRVKLLTDKEKLQETIKEKRQKVSSLETALSVKKQTDGVETRKGDVDLESKRKQIEDQKTLIEKLEKKTVGANVTAPVSGTIQSLSLSAGEKTSPQNPAAVIEMNEKGLKLSFSVKIEQAKKLKPGMAADVSNNYFGGDITAELSAIKPDNANPQTNKILEFRVTGTDVKAGDNITLTIGAKGQEYPCVIQNSALRTDTNGKYVLVVESKNSPLGSRYYAVRYPVTVLAENDTSSAVDGLAGSEFVIVTSSVPIEAGKQVKLSETQK